MKKIFKSAITAAILCVTAVMISLCASAETQDVEMSVSRAIQTNGKWGQSVTYTPADLDPRNITPDTTIRVEYELEGERTFEDQHQVELILQNYVVDPQIWAQVVPVEYDDTYVVFDYEGMVTAYGSDDFTDVGNICIGDRGVKMKVTKVTVTNLTIPEVTTTEATTTEATTTKEATTKAETTATEAAATAAESTESSGGGVPIFVIIIVVVVVAGAAVGITLALKGRKKFY